MTGSPATVDSHQLRGLLSFAAPLRMLDVRTPGEFLTAHIAGSYNVHILAAGINAWQAEGVAAAA